MFLKSRRELNIKIQKEKQLNVEEYVFKAGQ